MIRLFLLLSLPLYILDQLSKSWIADNFELNGPLREVIPGVFWLHHAANTGVAFGMLNGTAFAKYFFAVLPLGALALIYAMYKKGMFPGKCSRLAVALLVSGIFGNLTDRLFRSGETGKLFTGTFWDGYVVDFLMFDFGFRPFNPWPSFNVADSCVVCAAILLALASFIETPGQKKA